MVVMAGKNRMLLDAKDVYNVLERSAKECDLYTTVFPEGITIDHGFETVVESLAEALCAQPEEEDEEDEDGDV